MMLKLVALHPRPIVPMEIVNIWTHSVRERGHEPAANHHVALAVDRHRNCCRYRHQQLSALDPYYFCIRCLCLTRNMCTAISFIFALTYSRRRMKYSSNIGMLFVYFFFNFFFSSVSLYFLRHRSAIYRCRNTKKIMHSVDALTSILILFFCLSLSPSSSRLSSHRFRRRIRDGHKMC